MDDKPEDDLEKRVKVLEETVRRLLGPNPYIEAWTKRIQELEIRVRTLEDAAEEER